MKISGYPLIVNPDLTDYVLGNDSATPDTRRMLLSDLVTLFLNNIPAAEGGFGFVSSGLVWSADAAGSTRAASMTAGRIKVNTNFLSISAVTARLFTASKDTYIDILDNLDGTGTIVYTEVSNNAASPALAANSIRIGIIVTGATNIAAAGSVNQGQPGKLLPIVSSTPYMFTDSLGNIICPRDPNRTVIGYRETTSSFTAPNTAVNPITGIAVMPIIVPGSQPRNVELELYSISVQQGNSNADLQIFDGSTGGTNVGDTFFGSSVAGYKSPGSAKRLLPLTGGSSKTYVPAFISNPSGAIASASSAAPMYLIAKLA